MWAYQAIFEHSAIGIAFVGADGVPLRTNPALTRMLGYSEEEFQEMSFAMFTHPDDIERDATLYRELVAGGRERYSIEKRYVRKDGTVCWGRLGVSSIRGEDGVLKYAIGTVEDITARRAMAEKLRRSNEDYQRSNRDLEHFAYAASHDLQTPLRKIKNFAIHLEDEFGEQLQDPMAQKYLRFIIGGAERAQALVNGLLQFSRTGRTVNMKMTSLEEAVSDALVVLEDDIKDKGAVVEVGELPQVYGDRMLLTRVFQNLVGNAIKFRHPERRPEVRIESRYGGGDYVISVADNGIGIDVAHAERIFLIFQRLGHKNGTGLGLSLCKRIVERHHGRIWVESEPGKGSTFLFTIPNGARQHAAAE